MSGRRLHMVADRVAVGGFHVERYFVCRCGWRTPTHYNAGRVGEWFSEHQAEREAAGER